MDNQLTIQEKKELEPRAKVLAANGIAQSLAYTTERKYLNGISSNSFPLHIESATQRTDAPSAPYWIKITQVGKSVEDNAEHSFTAIQKILTACFIPYKTQLIFVVHGESGKYEVYLGIRSLERNEIDVSFVDNLNDFIQGVWPGMKCHRVKGNLDEVRRDITEKYDFIDSLTGIPSMESQYKTIYPATLDTLMAGMRKKDFTYMVVADPLPEAEIDGFLYQVRDYEGQAESLKTFTFSENTTETVSKALALTKNVTTGSTKKSAWGMLGAGLMLASSVFPPAGAITTALAIADGFNRLTGADLLSNFSPNYTRSLQKSEATTNTFGHNEGKSISQNIVNKQIEAVSNKLSFHTKRFESGKALGCWSVGVYLMSENRQDLQSASMQLKSIVSGQESINEPVRIHHIEDVIGESLPQTLAAMDAPRIKIVSDMGISFDHPLGDHFNDLRTVLTTKELSYFINFPQHSVPGINVVDASAQFSLTAQEKVNIDNVIDIGRLLWSGSSTETKVYLPLDTLSRHALVCGVNGSGKTNTVLSILDGFMRKNRPFFVIEPAKTEYVDWALEYNETVKDPKKKIKIFIPGCSNYLKAKFLVDKNKKPIKAYENGFVPDILQINPFEVIQLDKGEMRVLSHIDRLKSSFASAFPMQDILPVIMEHLLYKLYTDKCPLLDDDDRATKVNKDNKRFPTLGSVDDDFINDLMSDIGYARENTQNISAALRTRFKSLTYGWKNQLLNNARLTGITWDELFGSPVVVNLSYAGDDQDRAFIMSMLLQFLYEYRIAESEAGRLSFNSNECRHLVVVEEAHRVMGRNDNPESPQHKSGMMFSNFLSEVRAYGQGMMVVDQVPTRLIEDAIKNTNVKIIHKLVASDDSQRVAECIGLTPEQQKVIAKLSIGQAVLAGFNSANVMSANSSDIYLAQINKMK